MSANYKRGNRFFHYLHSLKVPTASIKPNILAAACRMLQERGNKTTSTCIASVTSDWYSRKTYVFIYENYNDFSESR